MVVFLLRCCVGESISGWMNSCCFFSLFFSWIFFSCLLQVYLSQMISEKKAELENNGRQRTSSSKCIQNNIKHPSPSLKLKDGFDDVSSNKTNEPRCIWFLWQSPNQWIVVVHSEECFCFCWVSSSSFNGLYFESQSRWHAWPWMGLWICGLQMDLEVWCCCLFFVSSKMSVCFFFRCVTFFFKVVNFTYSWKLGHQIPPRNWCVGTTGCLDVVFANPVRMAQTSWDKFFLLNLLINKSCSRFWRKVKRRGRRERERKMAFVGGCFIIQTSSQKSRL